MSQIRVHGAQCLNTDYHRIPFQREIMNGTDRSFFHFGFVLLQNNKFSIENQIGTSMSELFRESIQRTGIRVMNREIEQCERKVYKLL